MLRAMPEPRSSGRQGLVATLAAATAIIVSLASLYVAWRQSVVMERQLAASVWPSLAFEHGNVSDDGKTSVIRFWLVNRGVGPALVRDYELQYQGVRMRDASGFLRACCRDIPAITSYVAPGRVLSAGEKVQVVRVDRTEQNAAMWARLEEERFRLAGSICYCSALDDCWRLAVSTNRTASVDDCE
jgi:hypothetical protein